MLSRSLRMLSSKLPSTGSFGPTSHTSGLSTSATHALPAWTNQWRRGTRLMSTSAGDTFRQFDAVRGSFSRYPNLLRNEFALGSYSQQKKDHARTPSQRPVEIDHTTPSSLHLQSGVMRNSTEGRRLDKSLPAAALEATQHRRKLTTGYSDAARHERRYLLAAHAGYVPFAGRMETEQDHYTAAMTIDMRSSFTRSTLFGESTVNDPRTFTKPSQQGRTTKADALWGVDRMQEAHYRAYATGHISESHHQDLNDVAAETREHIAALYR